MSHGPLLNQLKNELESLYEIEVPLDIADFVITDPETARVLASDANISDRENLFIASDGDEAAISLFIDATVVAELTDCDPMTDLHEGNLGSFCVALEGVSHFTYVAWRAHHDRPVSQLELEMQAEVDKFVTVVSLMGRQGGGRLPEGIRERLFENIRFREGMDLGSRERYETANAYAGRYCERLEEGLRQRRDAGSLTRDLRRFYRLNQQQKIRHITALN
jgi:hypothetical protein